MSALIKICGLSTPETVTAAIESGADMIGLVFHPASPRNVEIEVAAYLASYLPATVKVVGLFVNPTDEILQQTLQSVRLDMIQLHGDESPIRVAAIRKLVERQVMKALSVETSNDLDAVALYEDMADWLILDARGTAEMPGGTGKSFDWDILSGFRPNKPWMLAGGLNADNVAKAIARTKPDAVDVSSGVESSRGVKDAQKIREFLKAAKSP